MGPAIIMRPFHFRQRTTSSDRDSTIVQELDSHPSLLCAHYFFDKSSFMASISMSRSAKSRFSREFSPSSSLSFLCLGDVHAAAPISPSIRRLFGYPVFLAKIGNVKLATFSFMQNADDPLPGKPLAFHTQCPPSVLRTLTYPPVRILGSRSIRLTLTLPPYLFRLFAILSDAFCIIFCNFTIPLYAAIESVSVVVIDLIILL